jgi:hypothetical protein
MRRKAQTAAQRGSHTYKPSFDMQNPLTRTARASRATGAHTAAAVIEALAVAGS